MACIEGSGLSSSRTALLTSSVTGLTREVSNVGSSLYLRAPVVTITQKSNSDCEKQVLGLSLPSKIGTCWRYLSWNLYDRQQLTLSLSETELTAQSRNQLPQR